MTTIQVPRDQQTAVDESGTAVYENACLIESTDVTRERQPVMLENATERRSVVIPIGNAKSGDCQWRNQSVILYSDGSYADHCDIHDSATFKGDRFPVTRKVKAGNNTVARWNWGDGPYCGAGETRHGIYHSGSDRGIEQFFDQITSIESVYVCD
jgi:hypothetical protein